MKRFAGKVALVTGGASGIGQAIAMQLAQDGAQVITAQRRPDSTFESIEVDLACPHSAGALVDELVQRTGRLDYLVNNAGVMHDEATVEAVTDDDWAQAISVNLTAPFLLIREAIPHLRKVGGSIVNIGSVEGIGANPRHAAYGATKAGLHGLTRNVAIDVGPDGIRCNAVAPGWVETEFNAGLIPTDDHGKFRQALGAIHPLRRIGAPAEIAKVVAWLLSDEASFVTGQIWTVDGGRVAQLSYPANARTA